MFETMHVIQVGIVAGIIITAGTALLHSLKIIPFNLMAYIGCLLTGKPSENRSIIAAIVYDLVASALLALIYVAIIDHFELSLTIYTACIIGLIKAFISGCIIPFIDNLNPCVKKGSIPAIGFFASNYGPAGVICFITGNIAFTIFIFKML